jgi:uncharacterized protein DUF2154
MNKHFAPSLLVTIVPLALSAQSWRTMDVARQYRDTTPVAVHVTYGAGRVSLRPEQAKNLFDMHLKYDAEHTEPWYQYDAVARKVEVGVRQRSGMKSMRGDGEGSELKLDLSKLAPMSLQLDVGAAQGDYDLSGLQIDELTLETGATESRLKFDTPNPRRMRVMRVDAGAATVEFAGLGNANVERIDANLGVGHLVMDFAGEWHGDVAMTVNSALGSVNVSVPNDVGVRVESTKLLSGFEANGLEKRNGGFESANFDTAKYKLRIRSAGVLGHFAITRQPK